MGDAAERQHDAQFRQCSEPGFEKWTARGYFLGRRLILRRHATHRVGNHGIDKRKAVIGARIIRALGKTKFKQRRIEEIARVVTREGAARSVGAVAPRRQANNEELSVGRAE